MASLASLREKLHKRKLERAHLTDGQEHDDVTDHTSWLKRIEGQGNMPEEWLEYTEFITNRVTFNSERIRTEYISNTYCQATKAIPDAVGKKSSAYAQLLVNFGNFRSLYNEEDARSIFYNARIMARRYSIIHIAAAQFELKLGNKDKCRKILDKAREVGPKPVDLFETAFQRFYFGYDELLTEEDMEKYKSERKGSLDAELAFTDSPDQNKAYLKSNAADTESDLNMSVDVMDLNISMVEDHEDQCLANSTNCTEELPNGTKNRMETGGFDCSDKLPGIAPHITLRNLPARKAAVLKQHLPFNRKGFTGSLLQPTGTPARGVFEMNTTSNDTPGHSDTESIISFQGSVDKNRSLQLQSSFGGDQADTVPLSFDAHRGGYNRQLRSHHSTPDCKNPGTLSMVSSLKKRDAFVGQARRVVRASLPHLPEEESKDERNDTFNMVPLPESPKHEAQPWVGGAHGDNGLGRRPSGSIPMDISICEEPPHVPHSVASHVSQHKIPTVPASQGGNPQNKPRVSPPALVPTPSSSKPPLPRPKLGHSEGHGAVPARNSPQKILLPQPPIPGHPFKTPQHHGTRSGTGEFSAAASTPLQMLTPQQYVQGGSYPYPHAMPATTPVQQMYPMSYVYTPSAKQLQVMTLNGKMYTILKCIGRGGSSKVYEALDPDNTLCAIKMVNMEGADETTLCSYKNEIALLQRLQKSHRVIKMYDHKYDESGNKLYVVMERGETDLATLFRGQKRMKDITTKFYWQEMLEAVAVLHREGIIHSDLKPANFLLVSGHLKLIDFGIANAIQQDMTSVTLDQQVGTLNFISPEAIIDAGSKMDEHGRPRPRFKIGVKSDVWSLGCILFHMVYGHTPFHSISNQLMKLQAIMNPHHTIDFPPLANKHLHDVLKRCLTRDPHARPTIDELLAHPYLKDGTEASTSPMAALDQDSLLNLMKQMANASSPRSLSALSQNVQGLLEQLTKTSINGNAGQKSGSEGPIQADLKCKAATDSKPRPHVRHVPRAPLTPLNLDNDQA